MGQNLRKRAYYNEIDPFAAAWLRELIKAGLIADGEVDERSITDVRADDVRGFRQCHFFAGIGGWSYALRLAGWPDDRDVWTGSCPCQPFSAAGKRHGSDDPRDLWPAWFRLIRECRPVVVFGEQVAAAIRHGWLDRLCDDLEREDYAVGPACLPSPCVGAFDIRQRLWFVADARSTQWLRRAHRPRSIKSEAPVWFKEAIHDQRGGTISKLANTTSARRERQIGEPEGEARNEARMLVSRQDGELGDTGSLGHVERAGGFWAEADWIACRDGKCRPVEPGTFPLATGIPARLGRLRGYGNSIKPQVAQVFIEAYMSYQSETGTPVGG